MNVERLSTKENKMFNQEKHTHFALLYSKKQHDSRLMGDKDFKCNTHNDNAYSEMKTGMNFSECASCWCDAVVIFKGLLSDYNQDSLIKYN